MAINVSIQHIGGFLPDIILLIQCYYYRGTRLNAMERFSPFVVVFFTLIDRASTISSQ